MLSLAKVKFKSDIEFARPEVAMKDLGTRVSIVLRESSSAFIASTLNANLLLVYLGEDY